MLVGVPLVRTDAAAVKQDQDPTRSAVLLCCRSQRRLSHPPREKRSRASKKERKSLTVPPLAPRVSNQQDKQPTKRASIDSNNCWSCQVSRIFRLDLPWNQKKKTFGSEKLGRRSEDEAERLLSVLVKSLLVTFRPRSLRLDWIRARACPA